MMIPTAILLLCLETSIANIEVMSCDIEWMDGFLILFSIWILVKELSDAKDEHRWRGGKISCKYERNLLLTWRVDSIHLCRNRATNSWKTEISPFHRVVENKCDINSQV